MLAYLILWWFLLELHRNVSLLFSTQFKFLDGNGDEVFQAGDCRYGLLNQVELLTLEVVSPLICSFLNDNVVFLANADDFRLVLG